MANEFGMDPPLPFSKRRTPQPDDPSRLWLLSPQDPKTAQADPYGLWAALRLIEALLTSALHMNQADHNMIVADLTQFDTSEMPHVGITLQRIVVAAEGMRRVLKDDLQSRGRGTGAKPMRRLVDVTRSAQAPDLVFPPHPDAAIADVQWSVRQALSLIQLLLCTEKDLNLLFTEMDEESLELVAAELEIYDDDVQLDRLRKSAELVIFAATLIFEELGYMMHPPG